ncbi:MAG: hypothetical protein ACR2GH_09265 [Pseudonocardia sp.]
MDDPTCDVILKGGLTSGVVYPPVVCDLAERYRLVNVGGASAGAIAAAVTAAAEYGRQNGGRGYAALAGLPTALGSRTGGDTALLALFEPQRRTRPLFRVLRSALGGSGVSRVRRVATTALLVESMSAIGWWRVLVGAVPGLAVLLVAVLATAVPWSVLLVVIGVLLLVVGLVAGTAWAVAHRLLVEVPANHLGIVNGSGSPAALTPWLSAVIDDASGRVRGAPLTMAELWGAPDVSAKRRCRDDPGLRRINLEVMTTNLGEGRPMRMPLLSEEYFFDEREFRELFPGRVVDVMVKADEITERTPSEQREHNLLTRLAAARGYRRMPVADLPVVVAARMSLSFPVLLSAVPLYKVDFSRPDAVRTVAAWRDWMHGHPDADVSSGPEVEQARTSGTGPDLPLRRCWISDGGITSNMPLHFFDAPLPRRPTFVVNLRTQLAGSDGPDALLAEDNRQGLLDVWTDLGDGAPTVPGLAAAILTTMQNWSDNTQMRMPGYRDRIVTVYLRPDEGGMNLDMDADRITELARRGHAAAGLLIARYATTPATGWRNQRWVRWRSLMAMVERLVEHVDKAWDADPGAELPSYREMLAEPAARPPGAYPFPATAQRWVQARAGGLETLAALWPEPEGSSVGRFVDGEPRPRPLWRAQPDL